MQDQLYKDFVTAEREFERKEAKLKNHSRKLEDDLMLEQTKLKKYEDAFKAIRGDGKDGHGENTDQLRARVVELTKQNAINEANLMKMGRKYQALDE